MPAIELYDVPPGEDDDFLAAWEAARAGGTLLRAIRADAQPRYVSIDAGDGEYELVHEEGAADEPGGVILLALAAVAPGTWAGRRGYLGMRVYSSPADSGDLTVARWSSPLMIQRAGAPYLALYQRVQGALA
jgi:hypothetical protein